jgi:hypothetical protein
LELRKPTQELRRLGRLRFHATAAMPAKAMPRNFGRFRRVLINWL